jgi:hypothetical protein
MGCVPITCDGSALPHTNAATLVSGSEGVDQAYGSTIVYDCDSGFVGSLTFTCGDSEFTTSDQCSEMGTCLADPHNGTAGLTEFTLKCVNWTDHQPLEWHYTFTYIGDDVETVLGDTRGLDHLGALLPAGEQTDDHTIQIRAVIRNGTQLHYQYDFPVKVYPFEESRHLETLASMQAQLMAATQNGSSNQFAQAMLVSTNILDSRAFADEEVRREELIELIAAMNQNATASTDLAQNLQLLALVRRCRGAVGRRT